MSHPDASADRSKFNAALTSLIAAILLTGFKIVVGLVTGSLGILAEAAHSGLDLVAAAVTVFAVRVSSKPADAGHTYGHGKVENLSALFETGLLLATCIWIIREAIKRLSGDSVHVDVNIWSFLVMGTSIVIDFSRSRVLYRAAKRFNSQALLADALHFETDIWSSAVVILGLVSVKLADFVPGYAWMREADAVAALGVAAIVVVVSIRLGFQTVQALADAAPAGCVANIIAATEKVPGVLDCHDVRVRRSGPLLFADVHITVDGNQPLRDAHELTEKVEQAVREAIPGLDLVVHPEPPQLRNQSRNPPS